MALSASGFEFLALLKQNNDRNWFAAHKEIYLHELAVIERFADGLLRNLNTHDVIETASGKKAIHRIYRDTRFSKDKIPYKTNWSGGFTRAGKHRRGGYYFHVEPGNSFIAGGFWSPNPQDLKVIRNDIAFDPAPLRKIINSASFISAFKSLGGEQVKTTPKGFDAGHEAIDLLRYKQFLLVSRFTDEEVLSNDFTDKANDTFKAMRPFFDHMSHVLSADINGIAY